MESDPNPFPKLELFSPLAKLKKVATFIGERLYLCNEEVPQRGAETMLYEQMELEYDRVQQEV